MEQANSDVDKARALAWARALRVSRALPIEDLTVQVKVTPTGPWHRKAIGGHLTACGIRLGGFASRDESYAGTLCQDGCFSRFEREIALTGVPDDDGTGYR
jgi:hypothetical protein